ncbi:hypothetical protein HY641_02705 [Candidatus Woesearchaeota archaeon]|nr:hypothetical protein [Candidatus Woesearchaeota archaeon]
MIKETYETLCKEHKLPSYEEMDQEFDLCSIEEEHHLLRSVKKRMDDRVHYVGSLVETIIRPNPESYSDMYECRYFSDADKKKVYELLREMHHILRSLDESNVLCNEKRDAQLINEIFAAWPALKKEALSFIGRLKDAWRAQSNGKEHISYLG